MARPTAKAGACSSHTLAVKANCLQHARRDGKLPSNCIPERVKDNITIFEDDAIKGRKSIIPFIKAAQKRYTEKTGQKCQASFVPYRESVLHINDKVTPEQLMDYKTQAEELMGWKCLGMWWHRDEGHAHSKYLEGDTNFAVHEHVHILWDCTDHESGKSLRPTRKHFSGMQDLLAACTGMERGNYAKDTRIGYRKAAEERIAKIEARLDALTKILEEKDRQLSEKDNTIAEKQHIIDEMVNEIDKLSKTKAIKGAAIAKLQEIAAKAKAGAAGAGEWAAGLFHLTDKDNTIKELQTQIQTLTTSKEEAVKAKEEAVADAKQAYTKGVKAGKRSVCDDIYKRQRWDATTTLKEVHSVDTVCRHFESQQKELEEWKEKAIYWHDAAKSTNKQSQGQTYQR